MPCVEIKSKWVKQLNKRARIIKLFEENVAINLCYLGLGSGLLDMTPKAQTTKEKIDKLGLHQNNKLCVSKDIIKKVKKTTTTE